MGADHRDSRRSELENARRRLEELLVWDKLSRKERRDTTKPEEIQRYRQAPSMKKLIRHAKGLVRGLEEQIASPLVFPNLHGKRSSEVPRGIDEVLRSTGLHDSGVTLHTLRHTYASHLVMAGVDLPTVKELMGHGSIDTTMRYAHVAPDHATKKGALMPDML